jgi:superfamily II DNA or RNA helicase
MLLTRKQLKPYFEPVYLHLGRELYEKNQVHDVRVGTDGIIQARVRDNGRSYGPQVKLIENRGSLIDIEGSCDCSVFANCKHVAACLLQYIERQAPQQDDLFGLPSDKWLYQSKVSRPSEAAAPAKALECLLYLLDLYEDVDGRHLLVSIVRTRRLPGGGYSRPELFSGSAHSRARYVSDEDKFALLLLQSIGGKGGEAYCWLQGESGGRALDVLIDTGRCHWQTEHSPVLKPGSDIHGTLTWAVDDGGRQSIVANGLSSEQLALPVAPPRYVDFGSGECGSYLCPLPEGAVSRLLAMPAVRPDEVADITTALTELGVRGMPLPKHLETRHVGGLQPQPRLYLFNDSEASGIPGEPDDTVGLAALVFDYAGVRVHPLNEEETLTRFSGEVYEIIPRDFRFERAVLRRLDDMGFIADDFLFDFVPGEIDGLLLEPVHIIDTWVDFMLFQRADLEQQGWVIESDPDFEFHIDEADDWYADIDDTDNAWFSLELGVTVDGEPVNLLPFLVNYLENVGQARQLDDLRNQPDDFPLLMRRSNGRILHVPLKRVRHIIDTLVELYDPGALNKKGRLEMSRYHGRQLLALERAGQPMKWAGGDAVRAFAEKLKGFDGVQPVPPPASLKADLRDYQREGLNWLQFLREYELGGVLADDMGLGKTVQALAHLLIELQAGRADRPSLVVAPTSLMVNWKREAERFAPSLRVLVLQGIDRHRHFASIDRHDLVLTTYPLLSRDTEVLLGQDWHLAILDEAQHIKNPKSKAAVTACQLNARHRLCLTGTPMENHLGELWSQMHFLMPGLLGDERRFRRLFRNPIEKHRDDERQRQLRDRVAPFMLRRNKSEVATELPPKTEIVSEVELDGAQRDLYETIRVSMSDKVREAIDNKGIERSRIVILDALLKLRQVCCHPQLLKLPSAQKVKNSAKLAQLMEMLPEMVEEGRRILLFSQFTSMLAIIEQEIEKHKIDYVKLTGKTKDRATPIDRFQSGEVPVFLISLKAGGSGLNLTAADTVIHYDPWWNPAAENQATDRAHRIGQDKPVFVYKMITAGTVEEKIIAMQQKKQALADALFDEGARGGALSAEDLQGLFEPLL